MRNSPIDFITILEGEFHEKQSAARTVQNNIVFQLASDRVLPLCTSVIQEVHAEIA